MKRILLAALLVLPLAGLMAALGCQDNSHLERDVASLKQQVAQLRQTPQDEPAAAPAAARFDDTDLRLRLERAEAALAAANKKIADLESRPAAAPAAAGTAPAPTDPAFAEAVNKVVREQQEADRKRREEERARRDAERTAEMDRIAKENGIDFDPNDVRGSIQRIMQNPEQRAKAMQVMRAEADKRRFANVGLDERQIEQVKAIEAAGRDRMMETMRTARESGATQEEITQQMQQAAKDQEAELKKVMTEEQYKKYQENGGAMGGMIPGGMGGLEGLGGMIPGMGGWGGRGR
ncbi:MAG: hypothetical protein HS108_07270 [Planctomycetes bacterium]|nr:hypothetical protein [Planctomycetota bacterium]MCL4732043.1 hypothetical protein [Planctomycetota bacterium]